MPTTISASPYTKLFDHAVLLLLKVRRFGIIKKVPAVHWGSSTGTLFLNTDAHYLTVHKRILDCPEYSAILQLDRRTQTHLREQAIPSSYLPGLYLIALRSLEAVHTLLETYQAQRDLLIQAFLDVYPFIQNQATLSLNTLYDPHNYPPPANVRQAFSLQTSYLSFDLPQHLHAVNPTLYEQEVTHARTRVDTMLKESQHFLRTGFLHHLEAVIKQLPCAPQVATTRLRQQPITKLRTFIANFPNRTVSPDDAMATLMEQTHLLLHGITPAVLKNDHALAITVSDGLMAIREIAAHAFTCDHLTS